MTARGKSVSSDKSPLCVVAAQRVTRASTRAVPPLAAEQGSLLSGEIQAMTA